MYLMGVAISKGAKFVGDKLKNTPLHVAVTGRDAHLVKELVATFRDNMYTEGKNKNDDRPIDIATRYGMTEIVRILSA